ncbi:MAG: molybdenum ABC transporter ATP-binding protein [Paracoccaceae bacterium]
MEVSFSLARSGQRLHLPRVRIPLSGVTAICGPSGAGKTTLLRAIAGFTRTGGQILCDGEEWEDGRRFLPPHRRHAGFVAQEPQLFDHLDVAGNLAFAERRAHQPVDRDLVIARLDIGPLLTRRTATLSGGEARRVALARALLAGPKLLLMDEPFTGLDAARRAEIMPYVEWLRDSALLPIFLVSHAPAEVARLASRVLALDQGTLAYFGGVEDFFAERSHLTGEAGTSLIAAEVLGKEGDGLCRLRFSGGELLAPGVTAAPGAIVHLLVAPRDVMIALRKPEGISALNILKVRVEGVTLAGGATEVRLDASGTRLSARITARSAAALALKPDLDCFAVVKSVALADG